MEPTEQKDCGVREPRGCLEGQGTCGSLGYHGGHEHQDSCVNQPILNSPGHMGVCQKPNFQAILAKCQTRTLWWLWQQMGRLEKKLFQHRVLSAQREAWLAFQGPPEWVPGPESKQESAVTPFL